MMTDSAPDLDLVFAALADPTRRAMLTELLAGPRNVGDLAEPFAMSLAAASKHLHVLARAGLVSQERSGRQKTCRLEQGGLNAATLWLRGCGAFETGDLAEIELLLAGLSDDADDREA